MKKKLLIIAGLVIFSTFLLLTGCGGNTTKVKPHQHAPGDVYCTYEVTAKAGGGAIPVGAIVCIYCPDPFQQRCDPGFTMEPAPGMTYKLKKMSNTCEDCPDESINRGWTYEYK